MVPSAHSIFKNSIHFKSFPFIVKWRIGYFTCPEIEGTSSSGWYVKQLNTKTSEGLCYERRWMKKGHRFDNHLPVAMSRWSSFPGQLLKRARSCMVRTIVMHPVLEWEISTPVKVLRRWKEYTWHKKRNLNTSTRQGMPWWICSKTEQTQSKPVDESRTCLVLYVFHYFFLFFVIFFLFCLIKQGYRV